MSRILVYTFLNFPYIEKIEKLNPFVFKKLKEDFIKFEEMIEEKNPEFILGVARSVRRNSVFETRAVNVFNKSKTVSMGGIENYKLDYPPNGYKKIEINKDFTDSFCNWTMYKISELISRSNVRLQFVHMKESDMCDFVEYVEQNHI